ncbi:MAG: NifB/NifX family molybdenum-iron cluster-binding protein [Marinilabiliales bacterium]
MKKLIAIPAEKGKLCPHFGHCEYFAVYETEDNKIIAETKIPAPPHKPGLLPKLLGQHNITDVITGGIGQNAIKLLKKQNINVYVGVSSTDISQIIDSFLKGTLQTSVNKCDH